MTWREQVAERDAQLHRIERERQAMSWTNVFSALPELGEQVLVIDHDGEMEVVCWRGPDIGWCYPHSDDSLWLWGIEVSHWLRPPPFPSEVELLRVKERP
jgi:hypothetical protein